MYLKQYGQNLHLYFCNLSIRLSGFNVLNVKHQEYTNISSKKCSCHHYDVFCLSQ